MCTTQSICQHVLIPLSILTRRCQWQSPDRSPSYTSPLQFEILQVVTNPAVPIDLSRAFSLISEVLTSVEDSSKSTDNFKDHQRVGQGCLSTQLCNCQDIDKFQSLTQGSTDELKCSLALTRFSSPGVWLNREKVSHQILFRGGAAKADKQFQAVTAHNIIQVASTTDLHSTDRRAKH